MARNNKAGNYPKELYKSPMYSSWFNMKTRCTNKNANNYHRYGGRGITFQADWIKFEAFLRDMQSTYKKGLSLERIDNDGNYCKENCKWATRKEQANNTKKTKDAVLITWQNKTKRISEWADELGVKKSTLYMRVTKYHIPLERALTKHL